MKSRSPKNNDTVFALRYGKPKPGTVLAKRYLIGELIGRGAIGSVYRGHTLDDRARELAIKFLQGPFTNLPGFVDRFRKEAQICQRLHHPNIVRMIDFGEFSKIPYMVLEFAEGITLRTLVDRHHLLDTAHAISIARALVRGLAHAHSRSVIHRDLTPSNIICSPDRPTELSARLSAGSAVKILDFGTARLIGRPKNQAKGPSETAIGTPHYMAPELATGGQGDERSDLYALGVILFEMVTGCKPYVGDSTERILRKHLFDPLPSPRAIWPERDIPEALEEVIVTAMKKNPSDRYQSAGEMETSLPPTV